MSDDEILNDDDDVVIEAEFSINAVNTDHSALTNRNIADQHTISAITDLSDTLEDLGATLTYTQPNLSLVNKDGETLSTVEIHSSGGDIEGGSASSVYLTSQVVDGGHATDDE